MLRRVDKRIAVQTAEPNKLGVGQTGNQRKHPALLGIGHFGLKTDQIIKRLLAIFLAQLHHRIGTIAGARIDQTHGAHRPEGKSFFAAVGHFFDRHTAFEGNKALEAMGRHSLAPRSARR